MVGATITEVSDPSSLKQRTSLARGTSLRLTLELQAYCWLAGTPGRALPNDTWPTSAAQSVV